MPREGKNLYLPIRFSYNSVVSNNAKRHLEKPSLSLKESSPTPSAKAEPRFATREMTEKALKRVMEIHGEAFRKLAE
jgi:hypothetical protein